MVDLVYSTHRKLLADDVTMYRDLRLSVLMRWLQEISIAHTEALGAGRAKTLDKGALWVVCRVRLEIENLPCYDETVTLSSWAGDTMRVLFPRYYEMTDESGTPLVKASAVWLLMDAKKRKMVFPENYDVVVPGIVTGNEIPLSFGVSLPKQQQSKRFKVAYSQVDINGHMNNAKYLDCMDDVLGKDYLASHALKTLEVEFKSEIKYGASVRLEYTLDKDDLTMIGYVRKRPCFELKASFAKRNNTTL